MMKSKFFIGLLVSLVCGLYASAQTPTTGNEEPYRQMSKLGLRMSRITGGDDLKHMYDTIKASYERRAFVHELPGYFSSKRESTIPHWVKMVVLNCLDSSNAGLINEAIIAAGALNIPCGSKLMAIYWDAPFKYGDNVENLRTSIIHSLRNIHDSHNTQFFLDVLTKGNVNVLNEQFEELLSGIDENRSAVFDRKLSEYSERVDALENKIEHKENSDPYMVSLQKIRGRLHGLQNRILGGQSAGNGGGK